MLMVDYSPNTNDQSPILYFTPYYYVLKQFSRSMRPGDVVVTVKGERLEEEGSPLHVCAVAKQDGTYAINILNTGEETSFPLQIGEYMANIELPANCVETIIVKL